MMATAQRTVLGGLDDDTQTTRNFHGKQIDVDESIPILTRLLSPPTRVTTGAIYTET